MSSLRQHALHTQPSPCLPQQQSQPLEALVLRIPSYMHVSWLLLIETVLQLGASQL